MKKRWLVNLLLLVVVAGLVTFLYVRPQGKPQGTKAYEVSSLKLADFNALNIEFPSKAPVSFVKADGLWRMTKPYQLRADQQSVLRILSVVAATSNEKFSSTEPGALDKFGLSNPTLRIKMVDKDSTEVFTFGTYNPVTEEQYVAYKDAIYLLPSSYSEAGMVQPIEMIDKKPLKPSEQVVGFDFSRLEQWQDTHMNLDLVDGQWKTNVAKAKPTQNELNEWLDFSWMQAQAKSVEIYTPDRKVAYVSFDVKLKDGKKVHFDRIQESPEFILGRPDEGLQYHFTNDAGFTMLNPPLNIK